MAHFGQQIHRITADIEGRIDQVIRKVCLDLFSKVVQKTPVDTGRAKGNWQCAVNSIPAGTTNDQDPNGVQTIGQIAGEALRAQVGDTVYLVNNLPYIERLENGWSQQAPNGMVKTSINEFEDILDEAVRETR